MSGYIQIMKRQWTVIMTNIVGEENKKKMLLKSNYII